MTSTDFGNLALFKIHWLKNQGNAWSSWQIWTMVWRQELSLSDPDSNRRDCFLILVQFQKNKKNHKGLDLSLHTEWLWWYPGLYPIICGLNCFHKTSPVVLLTKYHNEFSLVFPGCTELCPLDTFVELMSPYRVTPENWPQLCSTEGYKSTGELKMVCMYLYRRTGLKCALWKVITPQVS